MRIDAIILVLCEIIAFTFWAINYKKIKEVKYKLFTFYLGIIAFTELANLLFHSSNGGFTNFVIMHLIIPLQFIFYYYFLLYKEKTKKTKLLLSTFSVIYICFFIAERMNLLVAPVNFDSLSYGVGNLFLIAAIIISLKIIFTESNVIEFNKNSFFWIIMGLIVFYIGSFPYQNFRNYFWSKPSYNNLAYTLHYLSQAFDSIMYLLFAYAVKWKTK
jgi:drug/metabolite transporter (DMT)-like permease